MRHALLLLLLCISAPIASDAQINRIREGGQYIETSDIMTIDEPAVFVFYTEWEQASLNLLDEVESWSSDFPDLDIFFVDCVDQRTQVFKQFNLKEIPSIVVYDKDEEQVGSILYSVDDLEDLLKANDLVD